MGSADHAHSVSRIGYNNIIHNFELRPQEDGLGTDTQGVTLAVISAQDLHGYVQFRLATIRDIEGFSGVKFFPHLSPEA